MPSLFSALRGGTHPLAVGPVKPRPLVQARQIRPAVPVGAGKNWDPADRSFRRTTRAASADSEVRPGPRLLTLRPHHHKTWEAGPEALIHSLPADLARSGQRLSDGGQLVISADMRVLD